MKGLKVKCPNCKRVMFETTDKYNPGVTPNGSMVSFLGHYALDWLTVSTTGVSEMTCPECVAQLAPAGKLLIVEPYPRSAPEIQEETGISDEADAIVSHAPESYPCPVCGKPFTSEPAMRGHKASHAKKG